MLKKVLPVVGAWYEDIEQCTLFEVIAKSDTDIITAQCYDGKITEIEKETFLALPLKQIDQPEDWGAPIELEYTDLFENTFFSGGDENFSIPLNYQQSDKNVFDSHRDM